MTLLPITLCRMLPITSVDEAAWDSVAVSEISTLFVDPSRLSDTFVRLYSDTSFVSIVGASMSKAIILPLILASMICAANADEASHRQSASDLLNAIDFETTVTAGVNAALEMQIQQNPTLLPYREVFQKWAKTFLNSEQLRPPMVELYVANFTESELREMTVFYATPTGKKALTKLGTIMQESMALGQRLGEEHQPELKEMIRNRASELEHAAPGVSSGAAPN
ncbi:MAG: DUF2059 domain-containing protein [Gammaproteobacteria bacterium]